MKKISKILILGGPGSGKSWNCRFNYILRISYILFDV